MGKILVIKGADFSTVAVDKFNLIIGKVAIMVVANISDRGTTTGSGYYDEGSQAIISATAASGYKFVQWNDGNKEATRTITVGSTANTYTAMFVVDGQIEITTADLIDEPNFYINNGGIAAKGDQLAYNGKIVDVTLYAGNTIEVVKRLEAPFARVSFLKSVPVIGTKAPFASGYETIFYQNISDEEPWNGIIPADAKFLYVMIHIAPTSEFGGNIFPESITITT